MHAHPLVVRLQLPLHREFYGWQRVAIHRIRPVKRILCVNFRDRLLNSDANFGNVHLFANAMTTNYESAYKKSLVHLNGRVIEYSYHAGGAVDEISDAGPTAVGVIAKYE